MRLGSQDRKDGETASLRREAGQWLRQLRERRGYSQRALADRVGIEYYTFVSQIEAGRGRIPAERYEVWADALAVDPAIFVRNMLRFYEPTTFQILFGKEEIDKDIGDMSSSSQSSAQIIPLNR
jgi:transcriptional regulator with XRE-family HTH domain